MHLGSQRPVTFLGWILFSIGVHFALTCALLHSPSQQAQCPLEHGYCAVEVALFAKPKPEAAAVKPIELPSPQEPNPEQICLHQKLPEAQLAEESPLPPSPKPEETAINPEAIDPFIEPTSNGICLISQGAEGEVLQEATFLKNPAPKYPEAARLAGQEGAVILKVKIDKEGHVKKVALAQSSNHAALDERAIETVRKKWHFMPATKNGQPIESELQVIVRFCLKDA
jgi:protein TonB